MQGNIHNENRQRQKNVWGGMFLAGNHNNLKNRVPSILPHNLCLILIRMKQKKIKKADSKKLRFSKSPILKKNLRKFHRLVLGLVGLIDAKGIDVAQPMWP